MKRWTVHFYLAGQWMYDQIEASTKEEALDSWWRAVKSGDYHDFTTDGGKSIMRVDKGYPIIAEVHP